MRTTPASRIVDARVRVLRVEADDDIAMSFGSLLHRTMVLVEIHRADGLVGYGESWANFPHWAYLERIATLEEGVFPLIVGEDARNVGRIHSKLISKLEPIGRQWGAPGPIMQAISAADVALWDIEGKAQSRSIADIVGRVRDNVPIYASSIGPSHVREQAMRCRSSGYLAIKVRVGFGRAKDDENLATVRDVCGGAVRIYADANQAWDLGEAIEMAPILHRHNVAWVEEPLRGNRLPDLEAFHLHTGVDIATGENLYGREAFEAYARSAAIRILQPDISKNGGLTEVTAICQIAKEQGKEVVPHLYGGAVAFAATLQLAGCAESVTAIEYDIRRNPLRDALWVPGPAFFGNSIRIPSGGGLGLELNWSTLAHHADVAQMADRND
jgi:L-alanine-DL-glutamate epimerase-like enolase superfamily enzyme